MQSENTFTISQKIQFFCMTNLAKFFRFLGIKKTYFFADMLACLAWHLLAKRRRLAISNIEKHLELSNEEAKKIARQSFRENIRSFSDLLLTQLFPGVENNPLLHIATPENYKVLRQTSRPVVTVSGHMGAWEFFSAVLGVIKYNNDVPQIVVVRKYKNPAVHTFITNQREVGGGQMVGHRQAAPAVLRTLKKNGVTAFLVDHKPSESEGKLLPFLKQDALVNFGPALLAIRANALIIPTFLNRNADCTYTMHTYEALDTATLKGTNEEKILAATIFYTKAVEAHVKAFPEQWFWMHDRWRIGKKKKKKK